MQRQLNHQESTANRTEPGKHGLAAGIAPDRPDWTVDQGWERYTADDLENIGREIITLERRLNLREGFTDKDDALPRRMLTEKFEKGASKGHVVDLEKMKLDYYREMGWDERGIPPHE